MTLMVLARERGERLAVHWVEHDSGAHGVDLCVERAEGSAWRRRYGVTVRLSELWLLSDGIAKAIELAKEVRR